MRKNALIAAAVLAAFLPVAASAGEVQNRIDNQQARINQGVRNSNLTAGEAHRVDGSLDRIQTERNRDLRAGDGRLSAVAYHRLNRQENRLSDRIAFDKHNRDRR